MHPWERHNSREERHLCDLPLAEAATHPLSRLQGKGLQLHLLMACLCRRRLRSGDNLGPGTKTCDHVRVWAPSAQSTGRPWFFFRLTFLDYVQTRNADSFYSWINPVLRGMSLWGFNCLVMAESLPPHGPQHARPPCPSPTPGAGSNSRPLSQWWHPTISYSVIPFSACLQSFPAAGFCFVILIFPQWVSSSNQVAKGLELQLHHQSFQWIFRVDFFEDGLVGSPCSPRGSQESSPTPRFRSINSSVLCLLYGPPLTTIEV